MDHELKKYKELQESRRQSVKKKRESSASGQVIKSIIAVKNITQEVVMEGNNYEVRYKVAGKTRYESKWFAGLTGEEGAFEFAKKNRPALVYDKNGSFVGNFTFRPTTGYSGPASKPNV